MTKLTDEAVKALLDGATPGPWKMETVRTSCGTCHRIGPFPRPNYTSKEEGWACVYDDYPPGIGSPDLLSNARLIAAAPDLARALLAARAERDRLAAANAALEAKLARLVGARRQFHDACNTYDAKREKVQARRAENDWSLNLDEEYKAMERFRRDFIGAAEDFADAALAEMQARDDASTWHERRTMLPEGGARKKE